jgi:hypothetical protein
MKEILHRQNSRQFRRQVSPATLLDVCTGNFQRALVEKSGMITNQIVAPNKSEVVAVQGSPCAPAPQELSTKNSLRCVSTVPGLSTDKIADRVSRQVTEQVPCSKASPRTEFHVIHRYDNKSGI